jgi:BirA family biotin operon repressor/biotin-[acetyl-CoA-carboxylase] ligase
MPVPLPLLTLLADGHFHSGAALGSALGVTRSAVWKAVRVCAEHGIDIHSVRGKGYRLVQAVDLLRQDRIASQMDASLRPLLCELEIHQELDSTSKYLLRRASDGAPSGTACLAELQTGGRGRRGRTWVSPFGANIYLSVLWRFAQGPAALSGLSLAVGVAVLEAVQALGVDDCGLKWPNDVMWNGRKLAGVLLDLNAEASGPSTVVVGIGLNVRMPDSVAAAIDQPWVDLHGLLPASPPMRNEIAAQLLGRVLAALSEFESEGLAAFQTRWARWDCLAGQPVTLHLPTQRIAGQARGIDASGALLLESKGQVRAYAAGEVSVRATA